MVLIFLDSPPAAVCSNVLYNLLLCKSNTAASNLYISASTLVFHFCASMCNFVSYRRQSCDRRNLNIHFSHILAAQINLLLFNRFFTFLSRPVVCALVNLESGDKYLYFSIIWASSVQQIYVPIRVYTHGRKLKLLQTKVKKFSPSITLSIYNFWIFKKYP